MTLRKFKNKTRRKTRRDLIKQITELHITYYQGLNFYLQNPQPQLPEEPKRQIKQKIEYSEEVLKKNRSYKSSVTSKSVENNTNISIASVAMS